MISHFSGKTVFGTVKNVFGEISLFLGELFRFWERFWGNQSCSEVRRSRRKTDGCKEALRGFDVTEVKKQEESMRKKGYKGRCEKRTLSKCIGVCRTYDAVQSAYANVIQENADIKEFRCRDAGMYPLL